jgi:hypothetical protein
LFGRAIATLLGVLGGLLVALSGLTSFIGSLLRSGATMGSSALTSSLLPALVAIVLGAVLMILARPRILWWRGRSLTTGILLIVIAVASWVILGGGLVLVLGVLLAVIAGLIFAVEELTHRSLFRRFF